MKSESNLRRVVVAQIAEADNEGREALYVDGRLVFAEWTVYSCDIAEHVGSRVPVTFEFILVECPGDSFPQLQRDLKLIEREQPIRNLPSDWRVVGD